MSVEHLYAASINLAIFIIVLILGKKDKRHSDYILLVWLIVLAANFTSFFLYEISGLNVENWKLLIFEFTESSIFLHGPVLFFYALSLTSISFTFKPKYFLHFLPFIIAIVILIIPIVRGISISPEFRNILLAGKMISVLIYVMTVLKILYTHKNSVEGIFSNTDEKYITWLSVIGWGVLSVWLTAVVSLILERFSYFESPHFGSLITNVNLSFLLFVLGYFGVKQPQLFVGSQQVTKIKSDSEGSKYSKSGLSPQDVSSIHQKVIKNISNEKLYLNPELTLFSLADKLQLRPNHLSQSINTVEGKNFFDFINYYRIEDVKKNLQSREKDHLTLLGIAFECGFNSKASFNRTFKKLEGQTPSEYKKLIVGWKNGAKQ
ncbi:MAG: helix-turn-helix domain-containing protein [Reichenbachiella sp.]